MKLDITKAFDKVKKSKPKKTKQEAPAVLGEEARLKNLPDMVSLEFLTMYSDNLDEVLYPYVANRVISIGYASRYKDIILENIFGNEHHLGIFHYLQEKNVDGNSDKELVIHAEKLLMKGWHIRLEGYQYWLVNMDFSKIIEMTGKAPLAKEVAALAFDETSAHIFLDDTIASKIAALAKTIGHDADELASSGNLDVLLARVTDEKFGGYIINYGAWRQILKKQTRYETLTDGVTPLDLYEEGYRLDNQITYPVAKNAILTKDNKKYLIVPVMPKMESGFNSYLIASIASKIKKDLLEPLKGVTVQEVVEIKELRHTFALLVEYWNTASSGSTYAETLGVLNRVQAHIDSGAVPGNYGRNLLESLAAVFITEALLLGNKSATVSSVNIDSLSGSIYSYNSLNYFTEKKDVFDAGLVPVKYELSSIPLVVSRSGILLSMIDSLPRTYMSTLTNYQIDTKEYPGEFNIIRDYFETARQFILSRKSQ